MGLAEWNIDSTHVLCNTVFAGITVLLSLTVFSIIVCDMLPKTSEALPIIGREKGKI